ncbi:MAG: SseB family protein [Pelobacteraceae bacterium]
MVATTDCPQELTGLDRALQTLRLDMDDAKHQSKYYDIFLNTTFYVPTLDQGETGEGSAVEEGQVLPLVMESEGNDYLMLFDTEERLKSWAADDVKWVEVPGYILAATTMPPLHWALNVGTEYSKQFLSDEIAWLREVVERCNEAAAAQEQPKP